MTETPVPLPPHIAAAMAARQSQPASTTTPTGTAAPGESAATSANAPPIAPVPAMSVPTASTEGAGEIRDVPVTVEPEPSTSATGGDVTMKDSPAAVTTPARGTGTPGGGSRAASQHPEPVQPAFLPAVAREHGEETRRYLNTKVIYTLLDGLKSLAAQQPRPEDPLRWLGEYLIARSEIDANKQDN